MDERGSEATVVMIVILCPFQDKFVENRSLKRSVSISIRNGEIVLTAEVGTIRVILKNKKQIRIEDVLHVPELDRRLLSIPALFTKGYTCPFAIDNVRTGMIEKW